MYSRLVVLSAAIGLILIASTVLAQCGCGSTQMTYSPVEPGCTANGTPTPMCRPSASYITCNTPATSHVAYYAPVAQTYPARYVPTTRPYMTNYGMAGWSIYGTPKVYVPGEPVRNVLRAITP